MAVSTIACGNGSLVCPVSVEPISGGPPAAPPAIRNSTFTPLLIRVTPTITRDRDRSSSRYTPVPTSTPTASTSASEGLISMFTAPPSLPAAVPRCAAPRSSAHLRVGSSRSSGAPGPGVHQLRLGVVGGAAWGVVRAVRGRLAGGLSLPVHLRAQRAERAPHPPTNTTH